MTAQDWELLIKTALLGTARAPLPEALVLRMSEWGLDTNADPARAALELLAAAQLQRRAGARPGQAKPAASAAPSTLHLPPTALSDLLDRILMGDRFRALDECLDLLGRTGLNLPPEFVPALLDRAARDVSFFEKIRPAVGPLGAWLAAQNPVWRHLYEDQATDNWETGSFAERLRLLEKTRKTHPLVGLAQLEKTWSAERPEQKLRFLHALRIRLSVLDEDFLEKILTREKKRELRQTAVQLLLQLPGSRPRTAWGAFFRDNLTGVFSAKDLPKYLREHLPELTHEPVTELIPLLPEGEAKDWRSAVAAFLIGGLPPAETVGAATPDAVQVLRRIAERAEFQGLFRGLVQAAATFGDDAWLEVLFQFHGEHPDPPLWDNAGLDAFIRALPASRQNAVLVRLLKKSEALSDPRAALARRLEDVQPPWSLELLRAFAEQIGRQAYPLPHLRELFETTAYRCRVSDAESLRAILHPEHLPGWRNELVHFYDVIHFRRRLRAVFEK